MKKGTLAALFAGSSFATTALAGTVGYRVFNGGTLIGSGTFTVSTSPPYTNVEVPVGEVWLNTDVHIFDILDGGDPIDSLGVVTLRGWVHGDTPVRVVLADKTLTENGGTVGTAFDRQDTPLPVGLRHLGGVTIVPPVGLPGDTTLRNHAILSVNILGDITGDIVAGGLWRIDAKRDDANQLGGTISGNLRATRGDGVVVGFDGNLFPAIGYVRAGWQITGNIVADGERDPATGASIFDLFNTSTWGSVGKLIIGPSLSAPGLRGNVNCEYGQIKDILSTGQIGNGPAAQQRSTITAGVRLSRISMRGESSTGDAAVLPRPIYADVTASARGASSWLDGAQSSMSLVETKSDLVGRISMEDFFGLNDQIGARRDSDRKGIFVEGAIIGDIEVKYSFQYGDIIARSIRGDAALGFTGSVKIGQMLKGAVVAVGTEGSSDPLDGTIAGVEIGYAPDLSNAPRPNLPGFNGIQGGTLIPPPYEGANRGAWYTAGAHDFFTVDSTIRAARSIGTIHLKAMSDRLPELGGKYARPRVESPSIGILTVDSFDTGVVWSGKLNSTTSVVTDDLTDDYASIGEVHIGCVGPKADLWVQDTPSIDIAGDMFGEVHLKELPSGQVLRIGGRFGDLQQAQSSVALCMSEYVGGGFDGVSPVENSPRGVWAAVENNVSGLPGIADYGRILIRTPQRLRGQIILDAYRTTDFTQDAATRWRGDIEVGTGQAANLNLPGTPVVISTNVGRASANALGPAYSLGSGPLGGLISCVGTAHQQEMQAGAVGLPAFTLYPSDARFIDINQGSCQDDPMYPATLNQAQFCQYTTTANGTPTGVHRVGVRLPFYGPVMTTVVYGASPLFIEWHRDALPGEPPVTCATTTGWFDVSSRCGTAMVHNDPQHSQSRFATLWGLHVLEPSRMLPPGHYRVSIASPGQIRSDGMLGAASPAVPQFSYCFHLEAGGGPVDPGDGACVADLDDGSGTGTPDGGVTIDDLLYFLAAYEAGTFQADMDDGSGGGVTDGGVTIDDLLFYLWRYEAGC